MNNKVLISLLFVIAGCSSKEVKREYHLNGKLKAETPLNREGKVDGKIVFYHEDGSIWCEYDYVDGVQDGDEKERNSDNMLTLHTRYLRGKEHGLRQEFYDNGKKKTIRYFIHGKLEGRSIEYYSNGQKKRIRYWKNDRQYGPDTMWDETGSFINVKMIDTK